MKTDRTAVMATAILIAGLLIGGTGGAIATGQIDTGQVDHEASTTQKLAGAKKAQGAEVIQYIGDGALLDTENSVLVTLPGTWDATSIANSSWSVQLVRNGPPSFVFPLGQAAPSGENPNNGFYIIVDNGQARVQVNAESYGTIDTIRVNRTVRTGSNSNTTVSVEVVPTGRAGG